jgi:hypothetical protein
VITTDEAQRIATEVIGPATAADGQGWDLEEFDAGWLAREDQSGDCRRMITIRIGL